MAKTAQPSTNEQTPATETNDALALLLTSVREQEAATKAAREANKTTRAKKERVARPCEDGCGEVVFAPTRFVVGHDAKLKSALLKAAHGTDEQAAYDALTRLVALGWDRFFVARKSA